MKVLIIKQVTSFSSPNHTQLPYKWPGEGTSLRHGRVQLHLHSFYKEKERTISKWRSVTESHKLTSPRTIRVRQILQVKTMRCTTSTGGSVPPIPRVALLLWATSRRQICPRKAANERQARAASRLAGPGTSWNRRQL